MGKEGFVSIRVSKADKKLIEKDAKDEQRTISNLLIYCWKQWRKSKRKK